MLVITRLHRAKGGGRKVMGHFHSPKSALYGAVYRGGGALDPVPLRRSESTLRHSRVATLEAPVAVAGSSTNSALRSVDSSTGDAMVEPSQFASTFQKHSERQAAAQMLNPHRTLRSDAPSSQSPRGELSVDEEAVEERRWFDHGPRLRMAAVSSPEAQRRGGGIDVFGDDTNASKHRERDRRYRLAAAETAGNVESSERPNVVRAKIASAVDVPLLPVAYLRRHPYETPEGNGDVNVSGEVMATAPAARLHHQIQRNMLRQVAGKQWFRCRSCGSVKEEVPERVLKEGSVHDPRAGSCCRCDNCGSRNFQWLMDFAHRTTHARRGGSRDASQHGRDDAVSSGAMVVGKLPTPRKDRPRRR